jgi:hypothetical protein
MRQARRSAQLSKALISRLAFIAACSVAIVWAQSPPSKEYIRLGSRVIAIEAPPTLQPSSDLNVSAAGEPAAGQPNPSFTISGSPNSQWTATASNWITFVTGGGSNNTTTATGSGTVTYTVQTNTGSARSGSIQIQMESGTAIYTITQLGGGSITVSLATSSATMAAAGGPGTVGLSTSPNTLAWTISPQPCFTSANNGSVTPLQGTGAATINYSLPANSSTSQLNCSFTVSATGANSQTFTVTQSGAPGLDHSSESFQSSGGNDTINVLNATGWSVANNTCTNGTCWVTLGKETSTSVPYSVPSFTNPAPGQTSRTGTLTFSGGPFSSSIIFTVTQAAPTSGGPISLSQTSLPFPNNGATGYSVNVTATGPWTAQCGSGGSGGIGLTFYNLSNGSKVNVTSCGSTFSGSGSEQVYFDVTQTTTFSSNPLSATLIFSTSTASANLTITQTPASFTVGPSNATLIQGKVNPSIQFTAYFNGAALPSGGYSVTNWSASGGGTINSSGLFNPTSPVPTTFTSATVTATFNLGGTTASTTITGMANPCIPQPLSVSPLNATGSGGIFTFSVAPSANYSLCTTESATPSISSLNVLFSNTVGGSQAPSTTNSCNMTIENGGGSNISTFSLNGTPGGSGYTIGYSGGTYSTSSPATVYNEQCSVALPNALITASTNQFTLQLPPEFYDQFTGTKGIWIPNLNNNYGYEAENIYMGTYSASAPTETISPASATVYWASQQQQFVGMASGSVQIPDVTWSAPSAGTISSGLYTAPSSLTSGQTVTIQGNRTSDGSAICCGTVTFNPVSVSPTAVTLYAGQTQQFTLAGGGSSPPTVSWSMSGSAGTLSSGGIYTAPSSISSQQTVTITATSTATSTYSVTATVTLIPVSVSAVTPSTVSLEINQSQQFTATVSGSSNQALNWTLSPSGSASGSVTSAGLYTAPSTIPSALAVTITATSAANSAASSSASISLVPDTLSITPTAVNLGAGQSQQFTATVTGATNTVVTWSMSPTFGTLSSGGYYTAPATVTSAQTVVITATSEADPSLKKSVSIVVGPLIGITLNTSPAGLAIIVDGTNYTAPQTLQWVVTSSHTIAVASPLAGSSGTQYVFSSWSDSGAQSHSITVPSTATTYTVSFTTQYQLTTAASPTAGGNISPASEWVNAGTVVPVSATANSGYQFTGFSGGLSGTTTPQNLTMSAPQSVTANFTSVSPITVVSVTPNGGTDNSVTFTQTYSDTAGGSDMTQVWTFLRSSYAANPTNDACFARWDKATNSLFLLNDAGTTFSSGIVISTSGTLSNSQCTLNVGSSSVSTSGNTLTLKLALTFNASFAGTQQIWMYANNATVNSGWVQEGTWTVTTAPTPVSVTPSSGAGNAKVFSFVFSDPGGAGNILSLQLDINATLATTSACYFYYTPATNQIYLANNAGSFTTPVTIGTAGTATNSQCTLNAGTSTVTTSGNNLTLNLALSFQSSFNGAKNTYMEVYDGEDSGWVSKGTWTVTGPPAPTSVTPSSGTGTSQTFAFLFSDPAGASNISSLQIDINATLAAASACYFYYTPANNQIYLANNAGSFTTSLTIGTAGTASNSQCSLNTGSSSVTISGNNLTLNLAITFQSAFTGAKNVYMEVYDGADSGWVQKGTWTP